MRMCEYVSCLEDVVTERRRVETVEGKRKRRRVDVNKDNPGGEGRTGALAVLVLASTLQMGAYRLERHPAHHRGTANFPPVPASNMLFISFSPYIHIINTIYQSF